MHPCLRQILKFAASKTAGRWLCGWLLASFCSPPAAVAQIVSLIPVRHLPQPMERYDEKAAWALHVKDQTTIGSPLIRLRDVASPVEPSAPWWDRAGEAIIGLMPLDEQPMVIDRARLMESVARSTAMPDIRWSGASAVRVTFHRGPDNSPEPAQAAGPAALASATRDGSIARGDASAAAFVTSFQSADDPAITPTERSRITRLIQFAVDRYDVQLREAFDIQIDPDQPSIESLRDLTRVDSVAWQSAPTEGVMLAQVVGMNSREPVTANVEIEFSARPLIVVARENCRRGQVLSEADLMLVPAGRNVATHDVLTEIADAVGLQVQSVLQKQSPVTRSSVGPVTVVERGDLVEVKVIGGGITIATGAKSLASGAQGDLIPIETLEPRRKLMARVAGNGIVEILTRPPRVQ